MKIYAAVLIGKANVGEDFGGTAQVDKRYVVKVDAAKGYCKKLGCQLMVIRFERLACLGLSYQ